MGQLHLRALTEGAATSQGRSESFIGLMYTHSDLANEAAMRQERKIQPRRPGTLSLAPADGHLTADHNAVPLACPIPSANASTTLRLPRPR